MSDSRTAKIKSFSLRGPTLLLASFTLLSRLVGWVRDLVFASILGAGETSDAFFAAFRIPDFLFNFFVLGTLTVAFLPVFNRELVKNHDGASALASGIYTLSLSVMAALSFVVFIFTPNLM